MRYCIDIDGTICTPGTCKSCQYEGATPKKDRIEYVNKLYDEGHYITVSYTHLTLPTILRV